MSSAEQYETNSIIVVKLQVGKIYLGNYIWLKKFALSVYKNILFVEFFKIVLHTSITF